MSRFIKSSNRDSAALPFKGSGPPRLYALVSVGLTAYTCERLTRIAELAYSQRNIKAMEQAGRELLAYDSDAALYYLAMAARWQGRTDEAQKLFESIRSDYQARAIHALGIIHHAAGRFDEAAKYYAEAMHANRGHDLFAFVSSQFQVASVKSVRGQHEQSLDDLLSLWPVVKVAARRHPHLWLTIHNGIAVELLKLGKVEQAKRAASVATSSPLAHAYPETFETAREIAESERRAILVIVPARRQKVITHFQFARPHVRRKAVKPLIRRAPVACSIVERVTVCAPCHGPPFH